MSTTTTALSVKIDRASQVDGELYALEIPVEVSGTYATATKPNFNVYTALQGAHMGVSAVKVKSAVVLRDYNDGTSRYTSKNSSVALSSVTSGSTNDKVTFEIDSTSATARNGDGGTAEVADDTALAGVITFLVLAELTAATI